jgi:glycine cleavage system H protein
VSGQIIETNSSLDDSPELINDDPYGEGWIAKIKLDDLSQLSELIDSDTYLASIAED